MNPVVKVGNPFGTLLNIHISWLWILPLIAFTLVWYGVLEWLGAITASLLIFGSALSAELAQLWTVKQVGLQWQRMTVFLLGGVVERVERSNPQQEVRVAGASAVTYLLLCLIFIVLGVVLPTDSVQMGLRTVALFNAIMLLFSLLLRLTPNHDNVLHATLATFSDQPWPHDIMTLIHSIALPSFVIASVIMLTLGWLAFVCWAALAVMLSQITSLAEIYGEYPESSAV